MPGLDCNPDPSTGDGVAGSLRALYLFSSSDGTSTLTTFLTYDLKRSGRAERNQLLCDVEEPLFGLQAF